jgi:hypothetical protein
MVFTFPRKGNADAMDRRDKLPFRLFALAV